MHFFYKSSEVRTFKKRKKRMAFFFFGFLTVLSQIWSWCEAVALQHMHTILHTSTHTCSENIYKHRQSAGEIIGIPCSKPLPCSRPHTGKDMAPSVSQCCTPDVPACAGKCDPSLCATCSPHRLYNLALNLNRLS